MSFPLVFALECTCTKHNLHECVWASFPRRGQLEDIANILILTTGYKM